VVELEPGKKLALSGLSDHFTSVDQFIFMPDVHDPNMTVRIQTRPSDTSMLLLRLI
jgi:hypothetical protein